MIHIIKKMILDHKTKTQNKGLVMTAKKEEYKERDYTFVKLLIDNRMLEFEKKLDKKFNEKFDELFALINPPNGKGGIISCLQDVNNKADEAFYRLDKVEKCCEDRKSELDDHIKAHSEKVEKENSKLKHILISILVSGGGTGLVFKYLAQIKILLVKIFGHVQ